MRLTLLLASSVLAASLALAGCSTSGGSQAIPGSSSVAPMGHHGAQIVVAGAQHLASCPSSKYFTCLTIYKGSNQIEICISTSGNCSSGLVGTWTWAGQIIHVKTGKKDNKFKIKWSPNPGNPTVNTIKVNTIKDSKGKIKYAENITACESTSYCISAAIGLIGG